MACDWSIGASAPDTSQSQASIHTYLGVHLPPVLPGLDLLGLLVPLGLADHVGQQLEQRVGETLHDLVHPDASHV